MTHDYRDFIVWQKAIELTACIYQLTRGLYGAGSHMRKVSVSIATNIAEGHSRFSPAEFRHFLGIAQRATCELQSQLDATRRLKLARQEYLAQAELLRVEVSEMLSSYIHILDSVERKRLAARSQTPCNYR